MTPITTEERRISYGSVSSSDDGPVPKMILSASLQPFSERDDTDDDNSLTSWSGSTPSYSYYSPSPSPRLIFQDYWSSSRSSSTKHNKIGTTTLEKYHGDEYDEVSAQLQPLTLPLAFKRQVSQGSTTISDFEQKARRQILLDPPPRRQILPKPPPPSVSSLFAKQTGKQMWSSTTALSLFDSQAADGLIRHHSFVTTPLESEVHEVMLHMQYHRRIKRNRRCSDLHHHFGRHLGFGKDGSTTADEYHRFDDIKVTYK